MSPREFDTLVEKAVRAIPPRFRRRLDNVAFVVEQEPPRPYLLGLYEGRPLTRRSVSDAFTLPDRITIFQGPHERLACDRLHLEKLLRDTVWHEVAHYFGLDERRVRLAERRRVRGGRL
jgi:predicted Zn-dependent protease with MMP-like domain